ncbi:MAG: metallophosphoesterase family protein [Leptolyngbya sp. IPPAS B-1204]
MVEILVSYACSQLVHRTRRSKDAMRWQRFFLLLIVGLVLSVGLACGQFVQAPQASESPPSVPVAPAATASPLPPETQAILASAGPAGLYNPSRGDVRLVVISDLNSAYGSTDYDPEVDKGIHLLPFWQPDLVLCSGDMVAGQKPSLTPEQIRSMWAAFDQHVAAPLRQAQIPFGFTVGNHDASSALSINGEFLFQQERELASAYWNDPNHDPGVQFVDRFQFPFYYSFEYNDIFFLAWDGSSNQIPAEKLAWVEQTLASPRAQQAKLRFLISHLPLYGVAVGRNEPSEIMANAEQLRLMLEKYNVHTYISGHAHAYYPAHRGKLQLLHTGILGSGPRPLLAGEAAPRKTLTVIDVQFDSPEFTTYTTYDMQTLQTIEYEELPRFLTGVTGMVRRRDVQELNAAEQRLCEQQLGRALCAA